MLIKLAGGHQ